MGALSVIGEAAADTALPAIDDDPVSEPVEDGDQGQAEEVEEEPEGEVEQAEEEAQEVEEEADGQFDLKDPKVQKWIKRAGLDPSDPKDAKTLKTLLDQDNYIEQLKGGGQKVESEGLTEYERSLQEKQAKKDEPPAGKQGEKPQGKQSPQYEDAGKDWKAPKDALAAYAAAWEHANETGDFDKVNEVEAAIYQRRFDAIGMPKVANFVQSFVEQFLQERLGDVLPRMRETVEVDRQRDALDFAYEQLEKVDEYKDIRGLVKVDESGPPILINGKKFPNTPLNKILAANPEILHIKREGRNQEESDRLTYLARLKMAHKIHASNRISRGTAQKLVDSGAKIAQKKQRDQVRQSLNGGGRANTKLAPGQSTGAKSYVEELLEDPDGPRSFAAL
jgi:hypothetical protein